MATRLLLPLRFFMIPRVLNSSYGNASQRCSLLMKGNHEMLNRP